MLRKNKLAFLVIAATLVGFVSLLSAWPVSCPSGYFISWSSSTSTWNYPSSWYSSQGAACDDDENLPEVEDTIPKESQGGAWNGYNYYFGCCTKLVS